MVATVAVVVNGDIRELKQGREGTTVTPVKQN